MGTTRKPVKTKKLSDNVIVLFKQHIEKHLKDEEFKSVFLKFFEEKYEQQAIPEGQLNNFRKHFKDIFIALFWNYTIELITWEQYCLNMKVIRTQGWSEPKRRTARKLLSELYHYTLENVHSDMRVFTELKENKEFLMWKEQRTVTMSEDLTDKIGTNFPLGSSLDQLHFFSDGQLKGKKDEKSVACILNLNISNDDIKNLLIGFYLSEKRRVPSLSQFVYLFRYSLMEVEKEPTAITDFTFEVFEKQYKFYEEANKENVANAKSRSEDFRLTKFLIRFYVYLCNFIKDQNIQHNIFEGTVYNEGNIANYAGKYKRKSVRTAKLSREVTEGLKQYIENHLKNKEFKSLFLNFFENVYSQKVFTENERWAVHKYFEQWLITIFQNYTIELISWEQYCLSMKNIRVQNWKNPNNSDLIRKTARKMLSDFYQYAIENVYLDTKGLSELKEYKGFLIWEEQKSTKMNDVLSAYQFDRIGTNFPLGSSLNQLYLIPSNGKSRPLVLNLNVFHDELKSLLLGFYQSKNRPYNGFRLFIYLFQYSLLSVEKEPQSITDFTFEVFKKQYRFYQKANIINPNDSNKFTAYLIHFYVYLCKVIKEQNIQHNIFEGTHYNENILGNNTFTAYYEKGYKLIVYNPFEEVPTDNRWLLITSDAYANMKKNKPHGIDFLEVKDKFLREDLKYYVWKQSSMTVNTVAHGIYTVIDFLNFIFSYKQLNELNENNYVDADMLEQWGFYIGSKATSTRNDYIKRCKSYLKFYKDKYQIPQLLIDQFVQTPQDYDGGHPMTKHDIDLFSKRFQEQRSIGIIGELCYIIFNLAATTKLRSGEILALERDCIIETSEQTGVIQYHSKVTGNQKVKLTLPIEKINLIEDAIRLTEDAHSKANEDIAKYIFVKEDHWKKDRIIELVFQFSNTFSKVQKELEGQLDGKYRPYDLRTTFIDNLYTEGIKDGLPTSVIAEMAGNGEHTARKYYRQTTETQEYAEMFAGVTVSGVNVYGDILEEKDVEDLNPVEEGLGGCKLEGCVDDEEEYKCLICPHFATTANRVALFKERITRIKAQKESTLNSQERRVVDAELKLYTAYYAELLQKIEGEKNVTDV